MKRVKITDEMLIEAVPKCKSIYEVLLYFNLKLAGGSHHHYTNRIRKLNIDISHFLGKCSSRGKISSKRRTSESILVKRTSGSRAKSSQLVRALLESGIKHECSKCKQPPEWLGNKLTLDVDHINEDWLDDRIENLRFLCPNCHSQFSRKLMGG